MGNRKRRRNGGSREPMEFMAAAGYLAQNTGRLTRGDYLAIDGIRTAYFLATHADPDEMERLLDDARGEADGAFYRKVRDIYARCGRGFPEELRAAAGIPGIWRVMVTLVSDMLDTICPEELRDAIREDADWPEPEEEPEPAGEELLRLIGEVPGTDRTRLNPKDAGQDCRGCAFYLKEERRCRDTGCRVQRRLRAGKGPRE